MGSISLRISPMVHGPIVSHFKRLVSLWGPLEVRFAEGVDEIDVGILYFFLEYYIIYEVDTEAVMVW